MPVPTPEELDEYISILEDLKSVSDEPTPQLDAVLATLYMVIGNPDGKPILRMVCYAYHVLDQLNAKARDIADGANPGAASE